MFRDALVSSIHKSVETIDGKVLLGSYIKTFKYLEKAIRDIKSINGTIERPRDELRLGARKRNRSEIASIE